MFMRSQDGDEIFHRSPSVHDLRVGAVVRPEVAAARGARRSVLVVFSADRDPEEMTQEQGPDATVTTDDDVTMRIGDEIGGGVYDPCLRSTCCLPSLDGLVRVREEGIRELLEA